jgi:hypothetical protein
VLEALAKADERTCNAGFDRFKISEVCEQLALQIIHIITVSPVRYDPFHCRPEIGRNAQFALFWSRSFCAFFATTTPATACPIHTEPPYSLYRDF